MGLKRTDEFRQDAVRIVLTSGLTRKQVADDLGVGMSSNSRVDNGPILSKITSSIMRRGSRGMVLT